MADLDTLPERIDVLERKLDALSVSVDRRFDEVQDQVVEQRMYTEFAFDRVEQSLERGLARLDRKLDQLIDAQPAPSPRRQPKKAKRPKASD